MKKLAGVIIAWTALFGAGANAGVVEDVLDRGVLRVGMSSFTPWAMRAKDGEFIGFEPDVARRLAADMGVEVEIVATAWDGIIPALLAKKFDLIIGGMSVTPARNLQVNFSDAYGYNGYELVANKTRMNGASAPADFNRSEIIFAPAAGDDSGGNCQTANAAWQTIRQFDDEVAALQELLKRARRCLCRGGAATFSFCRRQCGQNFYPVS